MLFRPKYKLQIATACQEKWESMHPGAQGRFCDVCSKNVVDFTGMSTGEIARYFRNKPANVCGRFLKPQLEQHYVQKTTLKLPFYRRLTQFLVSLFFTNATAQSDSSFTKTDSTVAVSLDSMPIIALNGSLETDSTAVTTDTAPRITWNFDPACFPPDSIKVWTVEVTIVVGGIGYVEPDPEPSFLDMCKVKMIETIRTYRGDKNLEASSSHPPEKQPEKMPVKELAAVLPDDIRRRKD